MRVFFVYTKQTKSPFLIISVSRNPGPDSRVVVYLGVENSRKIQVVLYLRCENQIFENRGFMEFGWEQIHFLEMFKEKTIKFPKIFKILETEKITLCEFIARSEILPVGCPGSVARIAG